MKALLISFVVGLLVGVAYGVIRVKSPAPLSLLYLACWECWVSKLEDGYLQRRSKRQTWPKLTFAVNRKASNNVLTCDRRFQLPVVVLTNEFSSARGSWSSWCQLTGVSK
jgi:hypothetical protein